MKNIPFNSRRSFFKKSIGATAAAFAAGAFPTIIPSSVLGKQSPSNRINVCSIGAGRIARAMDMPNVWENPLARIVAVCDLDIKRAQEGTQFVNDYYAEQSGKAYDGVRTYQYYKEMLENKDIDAVTVSVPDHWHALIGIDAVEAGKDVYLQKPASLTISDGRALSNAVNRTGRILQIGSQQRSWKQFREGVELVRNGRIGNIQRVEVGLPGDPSGGELEEMPIPENLDYEMWLGPTPHAYYTETRVHPDEGYGRPGWLRCEQFGAGMITGWGAHHVDTAHWGMDTEYTGPIEIWGEAEFPTTGLWNVHGTFRTEAKYANGVHMTISDKLPNGIKFYGDEGWIWVSRGGAKATPSDPAGVFAGKRIDASDPKILEATAGPDELHLPVSDSHHNNWLESIISREQPLAPAEIGHRSCSTCLLHHMAMKVDRHLYWDPMTERFQNDDEANSWISRPQRSPYITRS